MTIEENLIDRLAVGDGWSGKESFVIIGKILLLKVWKPKI